LRTVGRVASFRVMTTAADVALHSYPASAHVPHVSDTSARCFKSGKSCDLTASSLALCFHCSRKLATHTNRSRIMLQFHFGNPKGTKICQSLGQKDQAKDGIDMHDILPRRSKHFLVGNFALINSALRHRSFQAAVTD